MEERVKQLEEEIEKIKARNKRVEADKAWETSTTRNVFISLSTYVLILIFMLLIMDPHPYLNALFAAIAYFISTLSYGVLKNWWLKRKNKYSP